MKRGISEAGHFLKTLVLILCFVLTVLPCIAAPVGPEGLLIDAKQPDGTILSIRGYGDDFYQRYETEDGYTVLRDRKTDVWYYAMPTLDGKDLTASQLRVGRDDPASSGHAKHLDRGSEVIATMVATRYARQVVPSNWERRRLEAQIARLNALGARSNVSNLVQTYNSRYGTKSYSAKIDSGGRAIFYKESEPNSAPPPLGRTSVVALCLLARFPDQPAPAFTRAQIANLINQSGYSDAAGNTGSVRDYFHAQSFGRLTYTAIVTDYFTASYPRSHYSNQADCEGAEELLREGISKLASVDMSTLTRDGTTAVSVYLLYAGNTSFDGLWPHQSTLWPSAYLPDGTRVEDYMVSSIGITPVIGTICHESGHMVLDCSDYYDYGNPNRYNCGDSFKSAGIGVHCLMGAGNYLNSGKTPAPINAYLKYKLGWATAMDLPSSGSVSIDAADQQYYRLAKSGSPTEYFILENKSKSPNLPWNAAMVDEGLAIWHVDEAVITGNEMQQMTTSQHYELSLEQADGTFDLETQIASNIDDCGDNTDYFDGASGRNAFSNTTVPNSKWWNGSASGLELRDISSPGVTMTFLLGAGGESTPANDQCSGAITASSTSYSTTQSTANATSTGDQVPTCVSDFGNGVWYKFAPASSGQLVVDTAGSDFDTGLAIYTGSCGSLTQVACDDDSGSGTTSAITNAVTGGTTYYILAGGWDGNTGNLVFRLSFTGGSTATLSVQASPSNGGSVSGGGTYPVGSQRQISAMPNAGWAFSQWQDGDTQNPRTVAVPSGGATYTANFILTNSSTLADAVDNMTLNWSTYGNGQWSRVTGVSHDGVDSARSGSVGVGQSTTLRASVTGPGTLTFWSRLDVECLYDWLYVRVVGGEEQQSSAYSNNWVQGSIVVPSGQQTVEWEFENGGTSAGVCYVDQVVFTSTVVDHFAWSTVISPQTVNAPFSVSITAKDFANVTVTNFTGTVTLSGSAGSGNRNMLGDPVIGGSSVGGSYTDGFTFTPNRDIEVTHVRHYYGSKVSIWQDNGTLVASKTIAAQSGEWSETPLAAPVTLTAGTKYRVGVFYSAGTEYFWMSGRPTVFSEGVIQDGCYASGDAFPATLTGSSSALFMVDLRYTVGAETPVTVSPTVTGPFVNGVWSGTITVQPASTNVVLTASDRNGHSGSSNPFNVTGIAPPSGPVITSQPQDVTVAPGQSATFSVTAENNSGAAYAFFWYKGGVLRQTAIRMTNSSYTVANAQAADAGGYYVVISNVVANVGTTSRTAFLTVAQPYSQVQVSLPPGGGSVSTDLTTNNGTHTFYATNKPSWLNVSASGTALDGIVDLLVWWDGVTLDSTAQANTSGSPRSWTMPVRWSGGGCDVVYTQAVNGVRPSITVQPQSRTNTAGTTASFNVTASGTAPLAYQWRKNNVNVFNGGNVSGATSANLSLANVQTSDAGNYSVVVTNLGGGITSQVATLTITLLPALAVNPASQNFGSIQVGTIADRTFYVTNTGGGTLFGSASVGAPFSVVSGGNYNLTANQGQAVVVRYAPVAVGTNSATVSFSGGSGVTATVSGSAYASPSIVVAPASQNFGTIQVGLTAERTFYVTNTGGGTLSGTASVSAPFSIASGASYSLAVNQGQPVVVRYSPTAAGTNTATVSFTGGAGASATVTGVAVVLPSPVLTISFTNPAAITINDVAAANPYPSTIAVSGLVGIVSNVTVTLRGLTHTYPHDLGVLLVGPKNQKVVVLANSGGYSVANATLGFNDFAATALTEYPDAPIASGVYKPSNCGAGDTAFPAGAPAGPYANVLSVCNGGSPNGTWSLYVQDDSGGDIGSIANGWSLSFNLIVPPQPPVISRQPQNQSVFPGQTAAFSLAASNALSYGWRLNGNFLTEGGRFAGCTSTNLVLLGAMSGDSGAQFTCVASNANGSVTSSIALLTVLPPSKPFFTAPHFSNGYFQATMHGAPLSNYAVEASSDLGNWKTLRTVAPPSGVTNILDGSSGLKSRFYRARLVQ